MPLQFSEDTFAKQRATVDLIVDIQQVNPAIDRSNVIDKVVEQVRRRVKLSAGQIKSVLTSREGKSTKTEGVVRERLGIIREALESLLEQVQEDPFCVNNLRMISEDQNQLLFLLARERGLAKAAVGRFIGLSRSMMQIQIARGQVFYMTRDQWARYEELLDKLKRNDPKIKIPPAGTISAGSVKEFEGRRLPRGLGEAAPDAMGTGRWVSAEAIPFDEDR